MLGRRGAIEVLKDFTKGHVEKIKKVDIDIFKSGKTKNMITKYIYTPVTVLAIQPTVSIDYANDTQLSMRFKVGVNPETDVITQILLDDEKELNWSPVQGEDFCYVFAYPTEPGPHTLYIESTKGNCTFEFYILHRKLEKGSSVDIPVDSYQDALLNVTKLWLLSSRFDRVRHADWAGFFDDRLRRYRMDEAGAKKVEDDLIAQMNTKIKDVVVSEVTATPLLQERAWDVSVVATDTTTQMSLKSLQNSEDAHIKISEREDIIDHKE